MVTTRTKRPQSEVIKSSAATLHKQISNYRRNLPAGELRHKLSAIEVNTENLAGNINDVFPTTSEETYEDAIRDGQ